MIGLRCLALAAILVFGGAAQAEEIVIKIENFTFHPAEITIKPGTAVTWQNGDDIPHSIVEDNAKFRSKALDTGEMFSMTFANVAVIGYFCGLHPHMKGKIVVKP